MRKFFAIIILAATLLTMFAGCGKKEPEVTTPTVESGVIYTEVIATLEKMLEPIADQYELTLLQKVVLEDGDNCQPVIVRQKFASEQRYHISLYYNQKGDVHHVIMSTERGKYTDISFALLSYYLYESLGLPEMEAQPFYDHFKLLAEEPDGFLSTDKWLISVDTLDSLLSFGAMLESELR